MAEQSEGMAGERSLGSNEPPARVIPPSLITQEHPAKGSIEGRLCKGLKRVWSEAREFLYFEIIFQGQGEEGC